MCCEHNVLQESISSYLYNSMLSVFNHFELEIMDDFGGNHPPPPVIALTTAAPKENMPSEKMSNYRIDFLRFWAVGEGE